MGILDLFFGKKKKTYVDRNGYRRFKDSNRLVYRWVAEKKIGRRLRKGEVVHHKNGNKLDNRESNLHVYTGKHGQLKHATHHLLHDMKKLFK